MLVHRMPRSRTATVVFNAALPATRRACRAASTAFADRRCSGPVAAQKRDAARLTSAPPCASEVVTQ
jgi:hypothetical protein